MKATGITRKITHAGGIIIPNELRRMMDLNPGDPMEVFVDKETIILKKYESQLTCAVTGEASYDNLALAGGKVVLSEEGARKIYEEIKSDLKL